MTVNSHSNVERPSFFSILAALRVQAKIHGLNARNSPAFKDVCCALDRLHSEIKAGVKMQVDTEIELRMDKIRQGLCLQRVLETEYGFENRRSLAAMVDEAGSSQKFKPNALSHMQTVVAEANAGRHKKFKQECRWQPKVIHPDQRVVNVITRQALPLALASMNPQDENTPTAIALLPENSMSQSVSDPWSLGSDPWSQGNVVPSRNAQRSSVNHDASETRDGVVDPWSHFVPSYAPETVGSKWKLRASNAEHQLVTVQDDLEKKVRNECAPQSPRVSRSLQLDELLPDTPVLQKYNQDTNITSAMPNRFCPAECAPPESQERPLVELQEMQQRLNQVELELAEAKQRLAQVDVLSRDEAAFQCSEVERCAEFRLAASQYELPDRLIDFAAKVVHLLPKSFDSRLLDLLRIVHKVHEGDLIILQVRVEEQDDEIDDLKADLKSLRQAHRLQSETAAQVKTKIRNEFQDKFNKDQQLLVTQRTKMNEELTQVQNRLQLAERERSQCKAQMVKISDELQALHLVNEALRQRVHDNKDCGSQTEESFLLERLQALQSPIVQVITDIVRKHEPHTLARLPKLLEKYHGQEQLLFKMLSDKHNLGEESSGF
eukprot:gnl/MRDRNA2_/MRDRNA2_60074_c0_seq1.p1 gnl/MRDRNA2_/MRDRNA2_60074_c0~~gnl/MRDRNA2_/MRDRNA2_60074_c0_seq1.p1  ORF type:complete len:606 (+),score=118.24 gnl/MRDRNA2_/MRDRNA2_60074_c0_seq1:97-1914(+)